MPQNSLKYKEIGERLRRFADEKFRSVAELERKIVVSKNSLSQYVSGRNRPGYTLQQQLRKVGCDIEWLMTGKTNVEYKQQQENSDAEYWKELAERYKGEMDAIRRSLPPQVLRVILETVEKDDDKKRKPKERMRSK